MKLIVGLGNPGSSYAKNHHNIGFICLNYFARHYAIRWDKKQAKARTGTGKIDGNSVLLAKPQTYMNCSGQSVSRLLNKFSVEMNDLIVIHDDLDLSPVKIRIRQGGGSGGHKVIDSIINELCSRDFIRIRFGIGRPLPNDGFFTSSDNDIIDFVLSDFTPDERQDIKPSIIRVSEAITCLINEGLEAAMNGYN